MKKISIDKLLKKVEKLTDVNNHTEARIELAKFFNNKECLDKLINLNKKHLRIGYMTSEMITERMKITKELFKSIPFELRKTINECL